mmetsp:Transcript_941/g.2035  ORF Transcript_941/g.2035 Transcript_941/m.2035 type:complete len:1562 (+) Transcript_941:110-4795(+)|eukprot:CAMPEP_0114432250 /NCGR_PEP_ID=MMETSP0103-20121206/11054_1 /TAXON_ID=37642 ORGANISM="Paraphysomonas imperforata, Strain PA2" /NCGR_SAMPLE_ID=MMETSP0103 /ASSEMBLY_ACC=CAM_ASM_000201 /LENGTH=1561 /DNA_ID=CAMNT_0001601911 /DNA_START=100 /DNA_END=4785 /DNA_ORIENTATION=-
MNSLLSVCVVLACLTAQPLHAFKIAGNGNPSLQEPGFGDEDHKALFTPVDDQDQPDDAPIFDQLFEAAIAADRKFKVLDEDDSSSSSTGTTDWSVGLLAGSTKGYRDGSATYAKFQTPYGIHAYFDDDLNEGFTYVADFCNYKVRRVVSKSGLTITKIGQNGYGDRDGSPSVQKIKAVTSVQVAPNKEFMLISDKGSCKIKSLDLTTFQLTTIAAHPKIKSPVGIAITSNSKVAYIADWGANAVKVINMNVVPNTVTTLVGGYKKGYADGTGSKVKFDGLESIALSPDERYLYTTEFKNNVIRRISISTQTSITWAGKKGSFGSKDGIGTYARFSGLGEISFAPSGTYFLVPDYYTHKVRKVVITTRSVTTVAGSGYRGYKNHENGLKAKLNGPYGCTFVDEDHAVVGEYDGHKLRNLKMYGGDAPTPAPGTTAAPTVHCDNPDIKKYSYDFTFADGTRTFGFSDDKEVDVMVDGQTLTLHISCSDHFEGGWGEKGDPVEGVHQQITSWHVIKFKYPGNSNCRVYKECSDDYPTVSPTKAPTPVPSKKPTPNPSPRPTKEPTLNPTMKPTRDPTLSPTPVPTTRPTKAPTKVPTVSPTAQPSAMPTVSPTPAPTPTPPTAHPTPAPTPVAESPTGNPTAAPTRHPTAVPSAMPTVSPTTQPTKVPTVSPTTQPTKVPTVSPTAQPTPEPSPSPTEMPTDSPTRVPSTPAPTQNPTVPPTATPTAMPTKTPTAVPTVSPTLKPTATYAPSLAPTNDECRNPGVVIRLDNVEAYWCNEIVVELVEEVLALGVPISLGVIGGDGEMLSSDTYISSYLNSWATNPLVEITSSSSTYTSYAGQPLSWQLEDLQDANEEIIKAASNSTFTAAQPCSFVPPNGDFDGNTLTALQAENMDVLSSYCIWDPANPGTTIWCPSGDHLVAPNIFSSGVAMLPAGAVLGNADYWEDNSGPADLFSAVSWIEAQIDNQGFSVLQLKPVEFAEEKRGCEEFDLTKKAILKDLINYGADQWDFLTLKQAKELVPRPQSASCPTPPPRTPLTASPTALNTATDAPSYSPVVNTAAPTNKPSTEFTASPTGSECSYPPVVMFRMDNVEAYWCTDIAFDIADEFKDAGVPLNIGLIGKHGLSSSLSDDVLLAAEIYEWSQNPTAFELASNSHKFMDFEGESLEWQKTDLANAQNEILGVAGGYCPFTFIPPFGNFDHNTAPAMLDNGVHMLDVMSSYCVWDPANPGTTSWCPSGSDLKAPHIQRNGVYMLPSGAVLGGIDYWEDNSKPANFTSTLAMVAEQVANQGFSVISLSPYEFATDRGTCLGTRSDKVEVLRQIFDYAKANWDVQLFQDAKTTIANRPECSKAPTKTPTATPTVAPTLAPTPNADPTSQPTVYTIAPTVSPTWDEECPGDVISTYEHSTVNIPGGHETRTVTTTVTSLPDKVITATHETCVIVKLETTYTDGSGGPSSSSDSGAALAGGLDTGSLFAIIFGCTTLVLAVLLVHKHMQERTPRDDVWDKPPATSTFSQYPSNMGGGDIDDDARSDMSDNPHQQRLPGKAPSMKVIRYGRTDTDELL